MNESVKLDKSWLSMSEFAKCLLTIFDDTDFFSRKEWAKYLGVREEKITAWLKDEDIPRPSHLNMIRILFDTSTHNAHDQIEAFDLMANKSAIEVCPKNGKRMLPTVYEYMKRPIFSELSNKLAPLSPKEQEKLLEEMYLVPNE